MVNNSYNTLSTEEKYSKFRLKNIEYYIFAFCLFLLTPPFYVWHSISSFAFIIICSLLALKNIMFIEKKEFMFFLAFSFICLYIPLMNYSNFFGIIVSIFVLTLFIVPADFLSKVFKIYVHIYSITLIPSILVFILVYFFRINLPSSIIEPLNQFKDYNYVQYPFLVQPNNLIDLTLPRFFGYYDEPGVIGTVSGVILLSSGFNLRKIINIPIFIAGILSFSFVFFIIMGVYGLVFLRTRYKILVAIIIIGASILLAKNEVLDSYVFSRFKYENGKFAGDNRIGDPNFEIWYKQYQRSNDYYFGLGLNANLKYNFGGASYKDLIVNYGIIFFVLFTGLCVLRAYFQFRFKKEFFLYLFILLIILYQRPFITEYFYMFLILAPVSFMKQTQMDANDAKQQNMAIA